MNSSEFQRLHQICEASLQQYILEARNTCTLLGRTKGKALTLLQRAELVSQRNVENAALDRYQQTRRDLMEAAKVGPDSKATQEEN